MADSLVPSGMEKPIAGEAFTRALYNRNIDRANQIAVDLADAELKMPKGEIAGMKQVSTSGGLSGDAVMANLVVVSTVINRRYRAKYNFNVICSQAASIAISALFRKSVTTDATATGVDLDSARVLYTAPVANQGASLEITVEWKAATTETVNIKAILARLTGSALYDISLRKLVIEDLGMSY